MLNWFNKFRSVHADKITHGLGGYVVTDMFAACPVIPLLCAAAVAMIIQIAWEVINPNNKIRESIMDTAAFAIGVLVAILINIASGGY